MEPSLSRVPSTRIESFCEMLESGIAFLLLFQIVAPLGMVTV